jgi:hypothetical protein
MRLLAVLIVICGCASQPEDPLADVPCIPPAASILAPKSRAIVKPPTVDVRVKWPFPPDEIKPPIMITLRGDAVTYLPTTETTDDAEVHTYQFTDLPMYTSFSFEIWDLCLADRHGARSIEIASVWFKTLY